MSAIALGCIAFACVFGAALLGMYVRAALPEHHLSEDSKDIVKLGMGLIGTMAALILGLLIASAKSSFDTRISETTQMSANIILLDRVLAQYGSETKEVREQLRRSVVLAIERIWPEDGARAGQLEPSPGGEDFYAKLWKLSPQTDMQRALHAQALTISVNLAQTRLLLAEQGGGSIPVPFLVVLVAWLAVILFSFGLFAPKNATVIGALLICALSFSSAIFLISELDQPFGGLIRISSAAMRDALAHLGR